MIARVARLVHVEFIKFFAHPFLYLALAVLAAATLLSAHLQPIFSGLKETDIWHYNSIQLVAYGFKFGLKIATFILLIFSSMMFAGEFDRGTIKNLLTRPITRTDFFVAKGVTVVALAIFLFAFVLFVSLVYGLARGDLGGVWDSEQYVMQRDYGEIVGHARKAILMSFLPFLAAGFLGLLVSNGTQSSGHAVAITLVLFLAADVVTGMLSWSARQNVFLFYPGYALDKLTEYAQGGNTRWDDRIDDGRLYLWVPLAYIAAFLPPAYAIFRARNIAA